VILIAAVSLLYSRNGFVKALLSPLRESFTTGDVGLRRRMDRIFWPLRKLHEAVTKMLRRAAKEEETEGTTD